MAQGRRASLMSSRWWELWSSERTTMPPLSVTSPLLGTCPTGTSLKHEIWRKESWQVCQSKLLSQIHLLFSVVLALAAQSGIAEAISPDSQDTAKNCSRREMWDCRHWRLRRRELASRTEELVRWNVTRKCASASFFVKTQKAAHSCATSHPWCSVNTQEYVMCGWRTLHKVGAHVCVHMCFYTFTRNNQKSLTRVRVSVVVPTLIWLRRMSCLSFLKAKMVSTDLIGISRPFWVW